jgi:hypothetical protein
MLPVVDIGAADASVRDGDQDFVGVGERGEWPVGVGYRVGFVEDEREILASALGTRLVEKREQQCQKPHRGLTLADLGSIVRFCPGK